MLIKTVGVILRLMNLNTLTYLKGQGPPDEEGKTNFRYGW